jgi:hypothetical protein
MKFMLNVYRTNEYGEGCHYAFLNLNVGLANLIMLRYGHFENLYALDRELTEMHFYDCSPIFMDKLPDGRNDLAPDYDTDFIEVQADAEDFENVAARIECDRMVITRDSVYWDAIPKHCDWHIETRPIDYATVRTVLEKEARNVQ